MFLSFGMLIQAFLLTGAAWVVIKMVGRFPSDLAELHSKYRDFRTRNDPEILDRTQTQERRNNYRATCAMDFLSEVFVCGLLWGVTALAGLYALNVIIGIVRRIASVF